MRSFINNRWTNGLAGVLAGLVLSGLLATAALHSLGYVDLAQRRWLETQLHAAAAVTGGNMAMATGPVEEGLEGLFVLDFISGDLTCGVLSPRTGKIAGLSRRNVAADLGVEPGKAPKYMLLTGIFETKGAVANVRPARSLIYVADSNSGRYVGYMLPWNTQGVNQNMTQVQPLVPIGGGSARNVVLE